MILITGIGRCGTSVLMKYLEKVGFFVGNDLCWYDEIRAGYELSIVTKINWSLWSNYCQKGKLINVDDNIYGAGVGAYNITYRNAICLTDRDRGGFVKVIKDPRFTWHPDIIEAWWRVRQDFKLIICHRDAEAVMRSRNLFPEKFRNDTSNCISIDQYKIDFTNFLTRVLKLKIPYEILFFPNFLQDFKSTYEVLERTGFHFDYGLGMKVWDDLIDQTLLGKI
jgi:hypothetical protein